MRRSAQLTVIGLAAVMAGPGSSVEAHGPAEDDLAVVRRAVAEEPTVRPEAPPPAPEKRTGRKSEAQWLRVRIKEKNARSTVSVNLPLALARALGDNVPVEWGCKRKDGEGRAKIRLRDVLDSLDSGQDIVQVDSEDGTVRVWVE